MRTVACRLVQGQDLLLEIKRIVAENEIRAGVMLSAVGSLSESNIRVPVLDGGFRYINPADLEIDSVQGTVSVDGVHLHITVSDSEGRAWGGHVREGCKVRTTCELITGILDDTVFTREPDASTGFDELVVS